ncbi:MAG: VOC family protein [Betaproteobacteria bacterium]|nr:VOC family protein [Betaproteobacteria bacterium]
MATPDSPRPGRFIWHDLAAADTAAAQDFYRAAFGWTATTEYANGGQFIRLQSGGHDVGSMYALSRKEREHGVPSHWTPYVGVENIEAATHRVEAAGGVALVRPFEVEGVARIALVADTLGSVLGLWESLPHE